MDVYRAVEVAEGFGPPAEGYDEWVEAWQMLVDSGMAYQLQGWFGREANRLIAEGVIMEAA